MAWTRSQATRIVEAMTDLDPHAIMQGLAKVRPVFHNEADMQHAFAWAIHKSQSTWKVRLEYRPSQFRDRAYIDIWLVGPDS